MNQKVIDQMLTTEHLRRRADQKQRQMELGILLSAAYDAGYLAELLAEIRGDSAVPSAEPTKAKAGAK